MGQQTTSLLFGFRNMQRFQVILAFAALLSGVGGVISLKAFLDDRAWPLLLITGFLVLIFIWLFGTTMRAPTSLVAVAPERTRIRFAGFVDTVIDNRDILGVRLKKTNILTGIGVRTNFSGDVALLSTWGVSAEIILRNPIRVWLIPRLIPLKAWRLTLSIRHPEKLVDRFGEPSATVSALPARALGTQKKRRAKR